MRRVERAKLTSKGQLTIPKGVRDRLGVQAGDELEFVEDRGVFTVRKGEAKSAIRRYVGFLKHLRGKEPDKLVREMRGE